MTGRDKDSVFGGPADQPEAKDERSELDRALDKGGSSNLPPNRPKGILGEVAPDLYGSEKFEADLNAGISQENDGPVLFLAIILAYLLFFPLAFVLLWRAKGTALSTKVAMSIVMTIGVVVVAVLLRG